MKTLFMWGITLLSLMLPISLCAQMHMQPPPPVYQMNPIHQYHAPATPVKKDKISVEKQYFELDNEGLREYMESIRNEQPDLYNTLNPDLEELEKNEKTAKYIRYGGLGLGMFFALQGVAVSSAEADKALDNLDSEPSNKGLNLSMLGVLCAAIGVMLPNVMQPEKKDYLKFINKHNRQSPKNPINVSAKIDLDKSNNPYVGLNMRYVF